ncbi:MAG: DinB family protein [Acidobacteriota bacterium]
MTRDDVFKQLSAQATTVRSEVQARFADLSAAQLNWSPEVGSWSIAQCLDHLIIANASYFPGFDRVLAGDKGSALWRYLPWVPAMWGKLLSRSVSPQTRKMKAPKGFRPSTSAIDDGILDRFDDQQGRVLDYLAKISAAGVGDVIMNSPPVPAIVYSVLDACRIVVFHEQRHLQQAARVAALPEFPGAAG